MKTQKMRLDEIKIQSFITEPQDQKIKGAFCNTLEDECATRDWPGVCHDPLNNGNTCTGICFCVYTGIF